MRMEKFMLVATSVAASFIGRTEMPKFVDFGSDNLPSHLLELSCSHNRPGEFIPFRSARHF